MSARARIRALVVIAVIIGGLILYAATRYSR